MSDTEEADVPGAQASKIPAFRRQQITRPKPPEVDGDRIDNWKMWKQRWLNYCVITGLTDQSDDYKCALLLHCIGIEAMRIFDGMKFAEGEDRNKMADILVKYDQHFLGQTQEFFERFQFNRRNQESGESIDEYVSILRNMAKTCGFCDCMREFLLMDRLLLGITDDKAREELLSTHDLTLSKTIEICRAKEALKTEEINKVIQNSKKKSLVTTNTNLNENLEIMEKQRTILVRVLLKESVCSALKFTSWRRNYAPRGERPAWPVVVKTTFKCHQSVSATASTLLVTSTLLTSLKAAVKPLVQSRLIRITSSTQSNLAIKLSSVKWRSTRSRWDCKLTVALQYVFCPSATLETSTFALKWWTSRCGTKPLCKPSVNAK